MSDLPGRVKACPFCGGKLWSDDLVVWRCWKCHVGIEPGGETAADCIERLNRRALLAPREEEPGLPEAAEELLIVADLRGDSDLPHPADDDKLWTARMQTAWDDLRTILAARPVEGEKK